MHKKIIILTTGISVAGIGIASAALMPSGIAEGWTLTAITALSTASISAISAFGSAFSTSMQTNFERMISAIAVATKQEAISSNQIGEGLQKSSQVLVTAIKSQKQAEDVTTTTFDYSPATGQGFEPCQTNQRNHTLNLAFSNTDKNLAQEIATTDMDNRPGFVVESVNTSMGKRLEKHYKMFCTDSEAKQGLCSSSKLSGADVNAAFLFEASTRDSDKDIARQAYIQHILGKPDAPIIGDNKHSAQAKAQFSQKIQKDALLSVPLYSLQAIRMSNLQQGDYHNYSPNQLLKSRVNQYFGGEEANRWAANLATQTQRGLLVETLKVHGLEVWLHQRQYQQNQRIEANLATLILLDSRQKQQELQTVSQKLISQNGRL
jgi:hypothetical protein